MAIPQLIGTAQVYPAPGAHAAVPRRASAEVERGVRQLAAALCSVHPLTPQDQELAEEIGFPVRPEYRPFVAIFHGLQALRHAALATRVRSTGALALSEGTRVVGLLGSPTSFEDFELDEDLVVAQGGPTPRRELAAELCDLRAQAEIARRAGRTGLVATDEFLPELLVHGSPRTAARVEERVFGALHNGQLAATLEALSACDFDRQRTAKALPVHRNTLCYRMQRIAELTGLDLASSRDRALVWLAVTQRQARIAHAEESAPVFAPSGRPALARRRLPA